MDLLILEPKPNTPFVKFDPITGIMELKGRSTPENTLDFYSVLQDWLIKYSVAPQEITIVNVQLEYFNTSSSKCILDLFKKFAELYKSGHKVQINWFYEEEDEDMQEAGEDYGDILGVPFDILVIK
jgi:hypothetical protein